MLENKYFIVKSVINVDEGTNFFISLVDGHEVYKGHFPGNPVSPGVCSIEMIRECTEKALGKKLLVSSISRCRFLAVLTPDKGENLLITISATENGEGKYKVAASLTDGAETTYVTFSGEMIAK